MKIAIMQPYLYSYRGYFRLFEETELFIIYDCVQFSSGSWVHRNKFANSNNEIKWLKLPIKKDKLDTKINNLRFQENHNKIWLERIKKFPSLERSLKKTVICMICLLIYPLLLLTI